MNGFMMELPQLVLTAQTTLPLATGIFLSLVGGLVLAQERFSRASVSFSVLCLVLITWSVSVAGLYGARSVEGARFWARIAMCSVPMMVPASFYFVITMLGSRERWRNLFRACTVLSLLIVGLHVPTDWLVLRIYEYGWGHFPQFGWLGNVMTTYVFVMIFLTMGIGWFEYQEAELDTVGEGRAGGLTTAFGMGCFAFIDLLPGYGFSIYPVGFLALNLFGGMTLYVQLRYGIRPLRSSFVAEEIFRSVEAPLVICDRRGMIRRINPACERLLGMSAERVRGRGLRETLSDVSTFDSSLVLSPDRTGVQKVHESGSSTRSFHVSTSRLIDDRNQFLGSLILFHPTPGGEHESDTMERDFGPDQRLLGTSPA